MKHYKRLYTVGDGYCHNHYWPMWSQLLSDLLDIEWVNLSAIGAGNEAIANLVIDAVKEDPAPGDSLYLVQWTRHNRFDLRVDDNAELRALIAQDPVYYKNFVTTPRGKTYWCSSVSELDLVQQYHKLVPDLQQLDRSRQLQMAATFVLNDACADWHYMFTYPARWSRNNYVDESRVTWESMEEFREVSQYRDLDVGEIQPVSSIHLDFLEKHILPRYPASPERLERVRAEVLKADRARRP